MPTKNSDAQKFLQILMKETQHPCGWLKNAVCYVIGLGYSPEPILSLPVIVQNRNSIGVEQLLAVGTGTVIRCIIGVITGHAVANVIYRITNTINNIFSTVNNAVTYILNTI